MKKIAFATCQKFPTLNTDDAPLAQALQNAGFEVEAMPWDAPGVNWKNYEAVVPRATWDYWTKYQNFRLWLAQPEVKFLNPGRTLLDNSDKLYLKELSKKGVNVVPTRWLSMVELAKLGTAQELLEIFSGAFGGTSWVIKPTVSGNAFLTFRFSKEDLLKMPDDRWNGFLEPFLDIENVMLQPEMAGISAEGEYSFIFFDRVFSHAALKKPAQGDFRVQSTEGGTLGAVAPPEGGIEFGESVLKNIPGPLLYARVDCVREKDQWFLMELELLEPNLYASTDEKAPSNFTKAFLKLLAN